MNPPRLIFIYHAGSGIIENIPGAVKKLFGGRSSCALCNITHGPVRPKADWAAFLATLGPQALVYHRDEIPGDIDRFLQASHIDPPVVLEEAANGWTVLITPKELEDCRGDERQLIQLVNSRRKPA